MVQFFCVQFFNSVHDTYKVGIYEFEVSLWAMFYIFIGALVTDIQYNSSSCLGGKVFLLFQKNETREN